MVLELLEVVLELLEVVLELLELVLGLLELVLELLELVLSLSLSYLNVFLVSAVGVGQIGRIQSHQVWSQTDFNRPKSSELK